MIRIRAHLGPGRLRLDVEGHDLPASDGRVCAAVSAIHQTALLGLAEIARQYPADVHFDLQEEPQP